MAKLPILPDAPLHAPSPYLLQTIMTLCREKGLSESRFGRDAAGDPNLVRDLRAGRQLRESTNERVVAHMATLKKVNPPRRHGQRLRDTVPADEHFRRVLLALGRPQVEALAEALIDHLDRLDAPADPEAPDFAPRSDLLPGDPGDAEPDNDGMGDPSWSEWHTRGRHKLVDTLGGFHEPVHRPVGYGVVHEDDEDDDPAEEAGDEHDTGNAEDDELTHSARHWGEYWNGGAAGCPIADVGGGDHEEDSGGFCPAFGIDQTREVSEGEAFHDLNGIPLIRVPLPENDQ
jgi:hypothetical protein